MVISWSRRGIFFFQELHPLGYSLLPIFVIPIILSSTPAIVQYRQIIKHAYNLSICEEIWVAEQSLLDNSLGYSERAYLTCTTLMSQKRLLCINFSLVSPPSFRMSYLIFHSEVPEGVAPYLHLYGPRPSILLQAILVSEELITTTSASNSLSCPFKESRLAFCVLLGIKPHTQFSFFQSPF